MNVETNTFQSCVGDNAHIYYAHYSQSPDLSSVKYHIIIQHGMIEHQQRHSDLIESLIKFYKGKVLVSAMDLVGHGRSGGHRAYINKFSDFNNDFIQFIDLCSQKELASDVKNILISHSLGGLVVLSTFLSDEYKTKLDFEKLIFVNPCVMPKLELPKNVQNVLASIPKVLSQLRVPLIYDAYDLSHDNEKAISFIKDPLISKSITINLGVETLKTCKKISAQSYFFMHKSFFLLSGDDRVVDNSSTQLFVTGMDKKFVKLKQYPNMRHDLLNETCRFEVFEEIINYINK